MSHHPSFGRRVRANTLRPVTSAHTGVNPVPAPTHASVSDSANDWSTADPDLEAWKAARKSLWTRLPWRQLSWVASLCFGIGSLVLPASVNHAVNWILYALMAASLIVGIRMRAKRRNASSRT